MQTWESFVGLHLPDVILASPVFELQETTGLEMKTLESMRESCYSDDQFVLEIFKCSGKNPAEMASVLSAYEPWKFGFSDEEFSVVEMEG
jgi:hypothetical protein